MIQKKRMLGKFCPKKRIKATTRRRGHYETHIELNAKGMKKLLAGIAQIDTAQPFVPMDPEEVRRLMQKYGITEEECMI